jgi:hypothetical protein
VRVGEEKEKELLCMMYTIEKIEPEGALPKGTKCLTNEITI